VYVYMFELYMQSGLREMCIYNSNTTQIQYINIYISIYIDRRIAKHRGPTCLRWWFAGRIRQARIYTYIYICVYVYICIYVHVASGAMYICITSIYTYTYISLGLVDGVWFVHDMQDIFWKSALYSSSYIYIDEHIYIICICIYV